MDQYHNYYAHASTYSQMNDSFDDSNISIRIGRLDDSK